MYESFSVVDIMLDEENPRFTEGVSSQAEAVNTLLEEGLDKLLALARDIAVRGKLDPINPPIVMRMDNDVVVLEGNRRFAAMKLLRNPDLARRVATRRAISRIRQAAETAGMSADGPAEVECYVADSREEARPWIELRHTGLNGGVGTDQWNSFQSNTFRRQPGSATDRAWLVVHAVVETFSDDPAMLHDVRRVRDEKFTNLGRLLARPHVRSSFGIDVDGDTVDLKLGDPFYMDILRRMFSDLVGMSVDEIKTGAAQDAYANKVVAAIRVNHPEGALPTGASSSSPDLGLAEGPLGTPAANGTSRNVTSPTRAEAGSGLSTGDAETGSDQGLLDTALFSLPSEAAPPSSAPEAAVKPARRRSEPRPEAKIFSGLTLRNLSLRTSAVLRDAQKVKIDEAPSVCAVMVRVIVEMVVTEVGVKKEWFGEGQPLVKKIRKALYTLDPNIENGMKRDKELAMAWTTSQGDQGWAVDQMNAFVHNFNAHPSGESVRALSMNFHALLARLDDLAGEGERA